MPTLALITVLYNSNDVLEDFFKSIQIQHYKDYKLYLIDNSPSAQSDSIIRSCIDRYSLSSVEYINSNGNIGVAAGNNIGIKKAIKDGCTKLLILNNDIAIEQSDLLERMVALSDIHDLITPKILFYDSRKIWMAGGYMDKFRALGVHYGLDKADGNIFNISKHISYAPTCFLLVNKSVFDSIGLMDEKYFAYYDDTDFVYRAIGKGFKIWYESSLKVFHKVSSSSGGDDSPFYIYYGNRNKIYFIRKHFKGVSKYFSLMYTLLSRVAFYAKYNKVGKKKLIQGMIDGFQMAKSS